MAKIYYFCGHEQFQPEDLVKHAVLAENVGFDGVFVSEHFNPWVDDQSAAGFAFSTLGAIAVSTKKIDLMTGVVTPLFRYHPAVVAQAAATIDRLSHGRFILGVGTGEAINEVPLGYTYPNYKERSARMKEALRIMRKLLDGEELNENGQFYKADKLKLYSPPLHKVPILLAAGGHKSALLAAEYSDGLICSVKNVEDTLNELVQPASEKASGLGRIGFGLVATHWSVFADDNQEAWNALGPWRGLRAPHRSTIVEPKLLQEEADDLPREEILSKYSILSSAEDYIKVYSPLITKLTVDTVVIQTTSNNRQEELIKMLGTKVLPSLKVL